MNAIDIGINLTLLREQKAEAVQIVKDLFAELSAFDGAKISPIQISGLTQLNESIKQQSIAFAELGNKLVEINSVQNAYVKLCQETDKIQGKLIANTFEEAKVNAELKVSLQEQTKALIDEAKSNNESVIARERSKQSAIDLAKVTKQANQDKISSERAWLAMFKEANAEANVIASEQKSFESSTASAQIKAEAEIVKQANLQKIKSEQEWQQMFRQANQESDAVIRKQIAVEKQEESEKIKQDKLNKQQIKDTLLQNDAYQQLLIKVKQLTAEYSRLVAAGQGNSALAKQTLQQLGVANTVVNQIDVSLQSVGSRGSFSLGSVSKGLTSLITQLRYVAYILPGLGIAGIFNLAFDAIGSVVKEMGLFNDEFAQTIEFEKQLADNAGKTNEVLKDRADIFANLSESDIKYYERMKSFSSAEGLPFEKQFEEIDNINKSRKEQADTRVSQLNATYQEESNINTQLLDVTRQRETILNSISDFDRKLNAKQKEQIGAFDIAAPYKYLAKAGQVSGLKDLSETFAKQLEVYDKQASNLKTRQGDINDALTSQSKINAYIEEERLKRIKYFNDQEREIALNATKTSVAQVQAVNKVVLGDEKSTYEQRLSAIKSFYNQESILANAEYNNVLNNNSSTFGDIVKANQDLSSKINILNKQKNAEIQKEDFKHYQIISIALNKSVEDLLAIDDIGFQKIEKNEKDSYGNRLQALAEFVNNKRISIQVQYNQELDIATKLNKTSEEKEALKTNRDKNLAEVENSIQGEVFSVIQSWFSRQTKLLEDQKNIRINSTISGEYEDLKALNDALDAKKISYEDYLIARKKLEQQYLLSGDLKNIENDKKTISELQKLKDNIDAKITQNQKDFEGAETPEDAKKFQDIQTQLLDSRKQVDASILDSTKKRNEDELKYERDRQKSIEDGEKQLAENRKAIIEALFGFVQTVSDTYYANEEERIQRRQELINEMYSNEQDAITRSSLSAKDKNAYELQLSQQKATSDRKFQKEERKIAHDQAVMNRDIKIGEIILNTEQAITKAYAEVPFPLDNAVAISYGILGGIALATALATKIPSLAKGVENFEGGYARYAESGPEWKIEPGKQPVLVSRETISYLPKGTDIIPMYKVPTISENYGDDSWAQTRFLARTINKGNKQIKNTIHTHVHVDLGFETYKDRIIHG